MGDRPAARRRRDGREQRGTLLDSLPRTPAAPRDAAGRSGAYPIPRARDDEGYSSNQVEAAGRLTLPSMPRTAANRRGRAARRASPRDSWEEYAAYEVAYGPADADLYAQEYAATDASGVYTDDVYAEPYPGDDGHGYGDSYDDSAEGRYQTRTRDRSLARPLTDRNLARPLTPALPQYNEPDDALPQLYPPLPIDSAPALAAFRPAPVPHRVRLDTRALAQAARSPWTIVRLALSIIAVALALVNAPSHMGEPSQPLMTAHAQAGAAAGNSIVSLIRPETQLLRPDLYDSYAQFQNWGGAACSAAALSEVLTAYGVPHATIGQEIDELGSYISPNGGLLNRHGFVVVAAKHNLRADESRSLTYNQIVYIAEQLGMPVIVNVRISYGYYHFFDGGHFLTVVGGDAQGLRIVDSSEYYIHYLPKDVFYQMFTGYTAAIVPAGYQYTLPK